MDLVNNLSSLEKALSNIKQGTNLEFRGKVSLFLDSDGERPSAALSGRINCLYLGEQVNEKHSYLFLKEDSECYGGGLIKVELDSNVFSDKKVKINCDGGKLILNNEDKHFKLNISLLSKEQTTNIYRDIFREAKSNENLDDYD